jgi:hypothetical protein
MLVGSMKQVVNELDARRREVENLRRKLDASEKAFGELREKYAVLKDRVDSGRAASFVKTTCVAAGVILIELALNILSVPALSPSVSITVGAIGLAATVYGIWPPPRGTS